MGSITEQMRNRGLSKRQAEVAFMVCQGYTNRQIGEKLFITEKSVKFHLTDVFRKLRVRNRLQLAVMALSPQSNQL